MMEIDYVTGRDPKYFPPIGTRIPINLKGHDVLFIVDEYGDGEEIIVDALTMLEYHLRNPHAYKLVLKGHIIIPKGSPINAIRDLLTGEEEK